MPPMPQSEPPGGAVRGTAAAAAAAVDPALRRSGLVLLALGCTACDAGAVPAGFAGLSLLVAAAGSFGAGWLAARVRLGSRLREARRCARLMPALVATQPWRTDAEQRLAPGPLGPGGGPPWEAFADDDATARFRQALQAHAAVEATTLYRDDRPWTVAAAPLFDAQGAFEGHLGIARPADEGALGHEALARLAEATPGALWIAARPAADAAAPWRVLVANAAAQERFGARAAVDDDELRAALPAALQAAWASAGALAPAGGEGEGWRWQRIRSGEHVLALVWQPGQAGADDDSATLSYTVSHDLRAPIRVVEGFTRILKEDYGERLDRIANDHLDRVLGAAARMNQMIDAMLALARLSTQPLSRQPVNLSQLAGWVVDDLRRGAPEREAEIEIEPGLEVQGDPAQLRLVLENLLGNAWKYTAKRPVARVSLRREQVDGRTVFVVRDNGAGFDMRAADRLFGLFQRLHGASDFPGTGVGLASVRRIVQRHGGEIWATGEPDRGAAFHFTLRA